MNISLDGVVTHRCGMCGARSSMTLTEKELAAFKLYLSGGRLIQACLPGLNKCEREFLKSGYCRKCQELLFGNSESERIKRA